ncbi:MAG: palindromic element RPE1 domain-containing protein [Rickettsia endosymbiont of Labidopullus appendiculatus]|nr:palindromic element RPE1 domain-containing protein [Rickettsia endosymbiont of Labidopullus appendiculatus]
MLNIANPESDQKWIASTITWSRNRLLSKLAYAEEFVGDTERSTGAYSSVREDASTGSTHKLPAEVEFRKKSNNDWGVYMSLRKGLSRRSNLRK